MSWAICCSCPLSLYCTCHWDSARPGCWALTGISPAPSDCHQWLQISDIISSLTLQPPLTVSGPALEHHVLPVRGDGASGRLGAPVRRARDHVQEDAAVLRHRARPLVLGAREAEGVVLGVAHRGRGLRAGEYHWVGGRVARGRVLGKVFH